MNQIVGDPIIGESNQMTLSRCSSSFFYVIKSNLSCDPTLYSDSKPKMIDVVVRTHNLQY